MLGRRPTPARLTLTLSPSPSPSAMGSPGPRGAQLRAAWGKSGFAVLVAPGGQAQEVLRPKRTDPGAQRPTAGPSGSFRDVNYSPGTGPA